MGIPDFNLPQYETLLYSLSRGTCIFFGAGVSKLAGYKLWDEVRNSMIEFFWGNRDVISNNRGKELNYSFCENFKKHEDVIETFNYLKNLDTYSASSAVKSIRLYSEGVF